MMGEVFSYVVEGATQAERETQESAALHPASRLGPVGEVRMGSV
jgi:hypothetical protein